MPQLTPTSLHALAANPACETQDIVAAIATIATNAPGACSPDADGQTPWTLACTKRNAHFLRIALRELHWNHWPELHLLLDAVLGAASSPAGERCVREILHAFAHKNALLQAHVHGCAYDFGQRDKETPTDASHDERLRRDTAVSEDVLVRVASAYPRAYKEHVTGRVRITAGEHATSSELVVAPVPVHTHDEAFFVLVSKNRVVDVIERLGADPSLVDQRDDDERVPLHAARSSEMAIVLLAAGSAIESRDRAGFTPLMAASLVPLARISGTDMSTDASTSDVVRALLAHGAQVDGVDSDGRTCVHWCAMTLGEDTEALKTLRLMRKSDPVAFSVAAQLANNYGETPLHTCGHGASSCSASSAATHRAIASLLEDAGSRRDAKDAKGRTAGERCDAVLAELEARETRLAAYAALSVKCVA